MGRRVPRLLLDLFVSAVKQGTRDYAPRKVLTNPGVLPPDAWSGTRCHRNLHIGVDRRDRLQCADPGGLKAAFRIPETQAKDVEVGQPAQIDTRNGIVAGPNVFRFVSAGPR